MQKDIPTLQELLIQEDRSSTRDQLRAKQTLSTRVREIFGVVAI